MTKHSPDISALIGSRICHDLISPVGAISNGLELMSLGGSGPDGPEFALVNDSAAHAAARIRLFRLAFGAAGPDQTVSARELRNILNAVFTGPQRLDWQVIGDMPRPRAKAACLALMCLEKCIGRGGAIIVVGDGESLTMTAQGDTMTTPAAAWRALTSDAVPGDLAPALVQFALLPLTARDNNISINAHLSDIMAQISL